MPTWDIKIVHPSPIFLDRGRCLLVFLSTCFHIGETDLMVPLPTLRRNTRNLEAQFELALEDSYRNQLKTAYFHATVVSK